jgi:curli biogenesis system outer membrane secretion channel CsgG
MTFIPLNRFACASYSALLLTGLYATLPLLPTASANEVQIAQAQNQSRPRIAVLSFDYSGTGNYYWWDGNTNAAEGVSDLLTNKLVQSGRYTMIERSRIDAVLQEQNLAASGRIDPSTAAQVGRILGADAVVLGSITRFNLDERGGSGSLFGFGGSSRRRTAEVQLTARIVNTTTSEIVIAAEGVGSADQGSGGFSVPIIGGGSSSADNDNELLSDAAEAAVEQLSTQLVEASSQLAASPQVTPTVDAVIADVTGNTVILNKGTQDGFRTGMMLSVERVNRTVLDPQTGEVLRTITTPIGRIELTEVDARSSIGRVINGTGFQIGDQAKAE